MVQVKKHWFLYGAAALCAGYAFVSVNGSQPEVERLPMRQSVNPSPFEGYITSRGAVEPAGEVIRVRAERAGRVVAVYARAGDPIRQGMPLFSLDAARERSLFEKAAAEVQLTKARLALAVSQIDAASIGLDNAQQAEAEAHARMTRFAPLIGEGVSQDEFDRLEGAAVRAANEVRLAAQRLDAARLERDVADAEHARAQAAQAETQVALTQSVVYAPTDGQILSVDVRVGDVLSVLPDEAATVAIGDMDKLYIRTEINEAEVIHFRKEAAARGFLRGAEEAGVMLRFAGLDPVLKPKATFADRNRERTDQRVLEVVYEVTSSSAFPLYAGQLLDVYIERESASPTAIAPYAAAEPAESFVSPATTARPLAVETVSAREQARQKRQLR